MCHLYNCYLKAVLTNIGVIYMLYSISVIHSKILLCQMSGFLLCNLHRNNTSWTHVGRLQTFCTADISYLMIKRIFTALICNKKEFCRSSLNIQFAI